MSELLFAGSLKEIAANYDALLLDLWGVIHDGQNLYPGAKECLQALARARKKIIFLSNAPRRAAIAEQSLASMGIMPEWYEAIITSGEVAYRHFADVQTAAMGKNYFYIGLEKDRKLLAGLDYREVECVKDADFMLLTHSYIDNQPEEELEELFASAAAKDIPVICVNPDREIVRLNGERVYCAGHLADQYHAKGGRVVYFGKPHDNAYHACLSLLEGIATPRLLAVGDSLATDIQGAKQAGIASALVTGGVLHKAVGPSDAGEYREKCLSLFERESIAPDYVLPAFRW